MYISFILPLTQVRAIYQMGKESKTRENKSLMAHRLLEIINAVEAILAADEDSPSGEDTIFQLAQHDFLQEGSNPNDGQQYVLLPNFQIRMDDNTRERSSSQRRTHCSSVVLTYK